MQHHLTRSCAVELVVIHFVERPITIPDEAYLWEAARQVGVQRCVRRKSTPRLLLQVDGRVMGGILGKLDCARIVTDCGSGYNRKDHPHRPLLGLVVRGELTNTVVQMEVIHGQAVVEFVLADAQRIDFETAEIETLEFAVRLGAKEHGGRCDQDARLLAVHRVL